MLDCELIAKSRAEWRTERKVFPEDIVSRIVDRARAAGATVDVEAQGPSEEGMTSLSVTPEAKGAAALTVAWEAEGDQVYLTVGAGTMLEVPEGEGRYADQSWDEELHNLVLAIVEGRFSERGWIDRRGRVLAARARFELPGRAVTVTTATLPWFYRLRRSEFRRYLPYLGNRPKPLLHLRRPGIAAQ